jgi:nitrogen fixation protein FixH
MTRNLTGRGVLVWLGAFFGLILVTNVIFITLAVRTFRGEDEQRPYLQGVEYNRTLARRAEQVRRGWQASIAANRLQSGAVRATVSIAGEDGKPLSGAKLIGELRHPANEKLDRSLRFREVVPGTYEAQTGEVLTGMWDVLVSNEGQEPFRASRRLWVQ